MNASRGGVIDNALFTQYLKETPLKAVLLDVWENEPTISTEMLAQVALGSSHIAGYSYDGKINGTTILFNALTSFLGEDTSMTTNELLSDIKDTHVTIDTTGKSNQAVYLAALLAIYDIKVDDQLLRESVLLDTDKRGNAFDQLRKTYARRMEASHCHITLTPFNPTQANTLEAIGFNINS